MKPDCLRECLNVLGWRTLDLAAMAKVSPVTARRWVSGKLALPVPVAELLEAMARAAAILATKPG